MSFNLIDEPWLPCLLPDGKRREFGIREVLEQAHEIRELRDGSPLVTAALHRLLLAVLHRSLDGPSNLKQWQELWEQKRFDISIADSYFDRRCGDGAVRDRFELFHIKHPFYQTPRWLGSKTRGANTLAPEICETHNRHMWHHVSDGAPLLWAPAQCARDLIAHQTFTGQGGRGHGTAPAARGTTILAVGDNLFETLMLNLVADTQHKFPTAQGNKPAWESDDTMAAGPLPLGYIDYLTWQARRILLIYSGANRVYRLAYDPGRMYRPQGTMFYDPFSAYQHSRNGDRAIGLYKDRALWRDSAIFFQFVETDQKKGPTNLHQLAVLIRDGIVPKSRRYRMVILGALHNQATVRLWRHERLPLPLAYLSDNELVVDLKLALTLADAVEDALSSAVRHAVNVALSPNDPKKADKARASQMTDAFAPDRLYWSQLEEPFKRLMLDLPGDESTRADDIRYGTYRLSIVRDWFDKTLQPTARDAFNRTAGQLDASARAHRAAVEGEAVLCRRLNKVRHEHFKGLEQETSHAMA